MDPNIIGTGKGYRTSFSRIDLDPTIAGNAIAAGDISRGDWVMLLNRIAESDGSPIRTVSGAEHPAAGPGYRTQIGFARITRISPDGLSVAVDGGSFDFVTSGIPDPDFGGTDPPSSPTYMVHLNNVINVYERSISISN